MPPQGRGAWQTHPGCAVNHTQLAPRHQESEPDEPGRDAP